MRASFEAWVGARTAEFVLKLKTGGDQMSSTAHLASQPFPPTNEHNTRELYGGILDNQVHDL